MSLTDEMLSVIEINLKQQVKRSLAQPGLEELHSMLAYHMGWEGKGAGLKSRGKRIRPLLVTLCTAACGGNWQDSLPSAAAVELVHNFSLLHDDIEDSSKLRRGRPTVWSMWGIPQAINAGDAMFALSHLAILDLGTDIPVQTTLICSQLLLETCLALTQGQFLDISFEERKDINVETYWTMITGKTGKLLSCCCELGARIGNASQERISFYSQFGLNLGLAFQALDDILGIWGNVALTGKSIDSDLASGKKTLPVLIGLQNGGEFAKLWPTGKVPIDEIPLATRILSDECVREATQKYADQFTETALSNLTQAKPIGQAGQELKDLANLLLQRKS